MDQPICAKQPQRGASCSYMDTVAAFATYLLENVNNLVAVVNPKICFIGFNAPFHREFELLYGKPLGLGQRIDDALSQAGADREKLISLCKRAFTGQSFCLVEELGDEQFLRNTYEVRFTPFFDSSHQPLFAVIVLSRLPKPRITH